MNGRRNMGKGKKSLLDYFRVSEEEDDDFDEDTNTMAIVIVKNV